MTEVNYGVNVRAQAAFQIGDKTTAPCQQRSGMTPLVQETVSFGNGGGPYKLAQDGHMGISGELKSGPMDHAQPCKAGRSGRTCERPAFHHTRRRGEVRIAALFPDPPHL